MAACVPNLVPKDDATSGGGGSTASSGGGTASSGGATAGSGGATASSSASGGPNPPPCDATLNPANGHCYKVYSSTKNTWPAAEAICKGWGGYLATMTSAEENTFVYDLAVANNLYSYWFGITDTATEGSFVWVSGEPVAYTNWHPRQPNNLGNNEDCGLSYVGEYMGRWGDSDCNNASDSKEGSFICER